VVRLREVKHFIWEADRVTRDWWKSGCIWQWQPVEENQEIGKGHSAY
jgi:hypothetical protein